MSIGLRGYETEQRQVMRLLHAVSTGVGAVLHVEGGWGSGRTLLARETAATARRLNLAVVDADWPADAVPELLTRAGTGPGAPPGPVLVVLDDLHLADPALLRSLQTLPWQLRDRPIGWLLSRRRGAGGVQADQLFAQQHPAGGHVDLRPLTAQAAGLLAADQSAGTLIGLPNLLRATAGNPLLTIELVRGVHEEGPDCISGTPPSRVRQCVRRCLAALSVDCRQLLQVGAVLGVRFALADAATMLRRPAADLLAPMEELLSADLLTCDGDQLLFGQEVFWRSVLTLLPGPGRAALNQVAADAQLTTAAGPPPPVTGIRSARTAHDLPQWSALSDTERTVARLVSQGLTNQQIASHVFRSPHTINYHLRRIFRKLEIRSRVDLARLALQHYSLADDVMDVAG
ncbi:hypothetical protein Axi01nite_72550 [Actinoplanes xinjiangensis]|nr:hypothetical protein Axi01nite_72550 [Actinoplanes xinjiangensis]